MSLNLDARQRAMLQEMGVTVWTRAETAAPLAPAAMQPVTVAVPATAPLPAAPVMAQPLAMPVAQPSPAPAARAPTAPAPAARRTHLKPQKHAPRWFHGTTPGSTSITRQKACRKPAAAMFSTSPGIS